MLRLWKLLSRLIFFFHPKICRLLKIESWKRFVTYSAFLDKISIWHLSSIFCSGISEYCLNSIHNISEVVGIHFGFYLDYFKLLGESKTRSIVQGPVYKLTAGWKKCTYLLKIFFMGGLCFGSKPTISHTLFSCSFLFFFSLGKEHFMLVILGNL